MEQAGSNSETAATNTGIKIASHGSEQLGACVRLLMSDDRRPEDANATRLGQELERRLAILERIDAETLPLLPEERTWSFRDMLAVKSGLSIAT